jgi:hypothetical protein
MYYTWRDRVAWKWNENWNERSGLPVGVKIANPEFITVIPKINGTPTVGASLEAAASLLGPRETLRAGPRRNR